MSNPFRLLEARRISRERERADLNKRLLELNRQAEDDETALRVLKGLYPDGFADDTNADEEPPPPAGTLARIIHEQAVKNIKDKVLDVLRSSYPLGLNAAQIRAKAFLKYKEHLNPNTLTVSLVRFRKDGKVRIEGREWFYVRDLADGNEKAAEQSPAATNGFRPSQPANRAGHSASAQIREPGSGGGG